MFRANAVDNGHRQLAVFGLLPIRRHVTRSDPAFRIAVIGILDENPPLAGVFFIKNPMEIEYSLIVLY